MRQTEPLAAVVRIRSVNSDLISTAARLAGGAEAAAAVAAHLQVEAGLVQVDPAVEDILRRIAEATIGEGPHDPAVATAAVGLIQAFLAQAVELATDPGRAPGWDHRDERILQGIGQISASIATAMQAAAAAIPDLASAFATAGARILDVGSGTAWLSIALARAFPATTVVGIDVFEPAMALAHRNVARAGLSDRIELRHQDVTALAEESAYDIIWLPLPFLPRAIVPAAVAASARALRPGGWLLPGTFAAPPDPLAQALADLRTVRSGGHPWQGDDLVRELGDAGLTEAHEVQRTWAAPARLFAARRPPGT